MIRRKRIQVPTPAVVSTAIDRQIAFRFVIIARELGEEYTSEEIDRLIDEGLEDVDTGVDLCF